MWVCSEENKLGSGGFGEVFRGSNITTGEAVAVKRVYMRESHLAKSTELEVMTRIRHENIVRLFHSEYRESHLFLIMELCEEKDLNNFVKDRTVSQDMCVKFMQNIAKAVTHLHKDSILHRDIKPPQCAGS